MIFRYRNVYPEFGGSYGAAWTSKRAAKARAGPGVIGVETVAVQDGRKTVVFFEPKKPS